MVNDKYKCCPPRTVEEQICDLYAKIWELSKNIVDFQYMGEYSTTVNYDKSGMIVSYNNTSYIKRVSGDSVNMAPNLHPELWQLLAGAGPQGIPGQNGTDGVGITKIENFGLPTPGKDFTVTHIQANLTNGTDEYFDVYAENGKAAQYIVIDSPDTATQGTLDPEQMEVLNIDPQNAYIMFAGEKYYPQDIQDTKGYRVYTHHGETTSKVENSKMLYLTLNTRGWVITVNETKDIYEYFINISAPNQLIIWFTLRTTQNFSQIDWFTFPLNGTLASGYLYEGVMPNVVVYEIITGIFSAATDNDGDRVGTQLTVHYLDPQDKNIKVKNINLGLPGHLATISSKRNISDI